MEIPNLVGQRLDEGLSIIKDNYGILNIVISEYTIPDDFHKKGNISGVKRIVRQNITSDNNLELVVFTFNETPQSLP